MTVRPIRSIGGDHEINEVFLDNVEVPVADLVGEEGGGWTIAKFLLENERGGSCFAPKLLADLATLRRTARVEANGSRAHCKDRAFAAQLATIELDALAPGPRAHLAQLDEGRNRGRRRRS